MTDGEGDIYHCPDKSDYRYAIRRPVHFDDYAGRKAGELFSQSRAETL
ncbi:hypothetical protein K9U65_18055 [Providencia stuartii]